MIVITYSTNNKSNKCGFEFINPKCSGRFYHTLSHFEVDTSQPELPYAFNWFAGQVIYER